MKLTEEQSNQISKLIERFRKLFDPERKMNTYVWYDFKENFFYLAPKNFYKNDSEKFLVDKLDAFEKEYNKYKEEQKNKQEGLIKDIKKIYTSCLELGLKIKNLKINEN